MPWHPAQVGGTHAIGQFVAAGDELLEEPRGSLEQALHDDRLALVDDGEAGLCEPGTHDVGEAHPSKLPGESNPRVCADLRP
jgi:hypothetical protein